MIVCSLFTSVKPITFSAIILKVDGDTSTNDCVIAMASGLSGLSGILTHDSTEARQFQACLDAVSTVSCPLMFAMHNIFTYSWLNALSSSVGQLAQLGSLR
jgi:N-acetylglutamate synthase/N-acetylornithine aminotransferase